MNSAYNNPPAENDIKLSYGRNLIYVLLLIQNPIEVGSTSEPAAGPVLPAFKLDIMTRASYYDN